MFLTRLKAGAVVLLASCTMASLTTLATERAQADRDDGRTVAALAAVASDSPGPHRTRPRPPRQGRRSRRRPGVTAASRARAAYSRRTAS